MKSTQRWLPRTVLASAAAVMLVAGSAVSASAASWTSECYTKAGDRDRCGYDVSGQVAAQAYYKDLSGERRMCAWDTLADGHSAAVRFRPYGSTDAYRVKWAPNGSGTISCTSGRPGAAGTRWTMEACIGEYGSRILLSCEDLKVVTL